MKMHLLVFPELSLDGHRDLVVLQFFTVQQLLQEVAFSSLLPDEVSRHGWWVWYTSLINTKIVKNLSKQETVHK